MSDNPSTIPIAKAIRSLRSELKEALQEGVGEGIQFELGPVELEFQVEVTWDAKGKVEGKGGINFGIISIGEVTGGGEVARSQGKTHTIKLTLNPIAHDGGKLKVSDTETEQVA